MSSTPEGIRTPNPRFRRPMLYPVELRARGVFWGLILAGSGRKRIRARNRLSICQEITFAFVASVPQGCGRSLTEPPRRAKGPPIGGDLRSAGSETRAEQCPSVGGVGDLRRTVGSETRAEQWDCHFSANANRDFSVWRCLGEALVTNRNQIPWRTGCFDAGFGLDFVFRPAVFTD